MSFPVLALILALTAAILLWLRMADQRAQREPTEAEAAAVREAADQVLGPMRDILRRAEATSDERSRPDL